MSKPADYIAQNAAFWNKTSDEYQQEHGEQLARAPMAWGMWSIPESELHVLGDVRDRDVLEFGCGGAQWSIALARLGARCVALDNSERQLKHARKAVSDAGVDVALLHANAESVPLADASFDIVFCDHGAMVFADPERTVPEAARLLRAGGLFVFSIETPLHFICWDENDNLDSCLHQNYFEARISQDNEKTVCFHLPHGEWIRLFRRNGLTIEDLIELRPPQGAQSTYAAFAPYEWSRKWPAEHIWRLRKEVAPR